MALAALQATTSAGEVGAQRCGFTSQEPNHTPATEAPQASPPACPVTCAAACSRGEVSPRQDHERVPQVQPSTSPAPQEHILTCFDCPMHEHDPINPPEGWGRCLKRNKGRYGCATACEAALTDGVLVV
jgi:hypothetical protein